MTTAVARMEFTEDQVGLITRTICKDATKDELALFLAQCRRTGLDPFARQIHAVKRWDSRQNREVMAIQVGIDGFRLIADRTGEADGQDDPLWCGTDGKWVDVWLDQEPPAACKVKVYRKGQAHGYAAVARWVEFAQTKKDGSLIGLWGKMPATMLAKCAESQALRKAFPAELSGLYAPEELPAVAAEPEQPRQLVEAKPAAEPDPDTAGEPDPVNVFGDYNALAKAKGKRWLEAAVWLNSRYDTHYGPQTLYPGVIPEDQRKALVEMLDSMPNAEQKAG